MIFLFLSKRTKDIFGQQLDLDQTSNVLAWSSDQNPGFDPHPYPSCCGTNRVKRQTELLYPCHIVFKTCVSKSHFGATLPRSDKTRNEKPTECRCRIAQSVCCGYLASLKSCGYLSTPFLLGIAAPVLGRIAYTWVLELAVAQGRDRTHCYVQEHGIVTLFALQKPIMISSCYVVSWFHTTPASCISWMCFNLEWTRLTTCTGYNSGCPPLWFMKGHFHQQALPFSRCCPHNNKMGPLQQRTMVMPAIPENKGKQKMEIQFFSVENNSMWMSFGKKLVTV